MKAINNKDNKEVIHKVVIQVLLNKKSNNKNIQNQIEISSKHLLDNNFQIMVI